MESLNSVHKDPEDINEGKTCSEPESSMEHFKKRLIHQCEEYTTVVDASGKEAGPGEKKEIRIARKKPNCRSKFRHKDLEIYKLGGNTVSTSLCKTREPYNVCKEKKLQEASETGSEAEKTNRSASKGRHALPAVVNPIPERRKSRTVPTKNMEDGNNNTDLCNSLEDTCNPPENSSQPPDRPLDSADKPESSVENSSNISPTIVAEANETAAEQIEEQIEQENPINLCVKKARPEDEVVGEVKERPRTLNIPVTNQYPLPMQRNVPTKPSQKIVPISTYQDLPTCTNVPTYQTLETQNQHNTNSLQEDILRSVISLVKDRFLYPFTADSLFILNNWYKYLNQCLIQDKLGPSFRMSVSVLRQTEDFVIENLCLFRCGQSTLPISRKFVQEILKADLNTYKDLLNHLLSRPNSTADWFSRFYDTLKACIQAPNSSRNVLPANSISSNINPSIERPPHSMPNLNVSMPISQGHCITTSQQPEPCCTRAQSNYCNATSSCASGQRGITTHPHYQRIYVPLDYPVPNTGNYSNGIPSFEPQQMSMVNPSLLQGGHSEYVPLQAQQEMHMAMMKQMSRYPHPASQGMQPPVISNRKNGVQQPSTAFSSVPEPQQARENLRVPPIDIPSPYVAANFKPGRPRHRRDYVPHDANQSVISHPIEPHQVTRNRRIYPKQVSVPVSATSQQSLGGLGFVHQPNAQHPMNTGLEQLRINEVHNPRDPRLMSLTSKPGGTAQSAVKSKYSEAKSQETVPMVRPPATIQQRRVSVISSTEQSRHSTQQTNPNLVVPVLHIPEASSANGWMNSNMPVPGVNQEKRLPMDSGTQQPRHYVPQHVIHRMAVSTAAGVPADAQIQHHDSADGVRTNVRSSGNVITSTTFAARSNAGSSSKPCTVTSASITEPTKVIVSTSQWTCTAQNTEKWHKEYAPTVPPNVNPVPENGTKQLNTTSTTIIGNVIKPVPTNISISSLGTQASSRRVCNGNNLETASDSTSECEGGRGSHGSSTVSAPIITQDIEEVIQTNVIVDPVKTMKRNNANVQNALPHIMATNNLSTRLNEDSQLTVLKHNNSKLQMIQTENGSRSKKVTDTMNAVEERGTRNADDNAKDLNSSENELRLIKEVLRHQFKDTYPEIVRRVLLAKEEQGKLINGGTDVDREETISVRSDSTSSMSPKRQSEVELDGAAKRVKSEDFYKGNVNVEPDISKSYTKSLKPSLPIIEDISSDEDTATADFATNQKADLQFRESKASENISSNQAFVHAVKTRQQSLMPNLLSYQLKSGEPTPTITFSLPKTPESPNVPLPEVWQAWLNEERLRGNSFFTPYSTRRQSIETISSVGSDYSPRLNSDDVEIRIDSKWYRVKKHIYDRIPKGKLYYLQQSNRFIRYFDDNQIEQFYRSIGVKTASSSDVGRTKPRVENNAETFVIPSDPSQVNELIEVGKEVTFSTEDQLREPEMYVEEIENVRRYVPIDFFGFYQFVTGYQIVRHNYPISFLTFLLLHNTNRIRKLLCDYVTALMQGQCMH